jgi:3-methyladenine DNA glycosylase AlkD
MFQTLPYWSRVICVSSPQEFFIRKAIGWALRVYARVDGAAVRDFCERMNGRLSALSVKEALKHQGNSKNFKVVV